MVPRSIARQRETHSYDHVELNAELALRERIHREMADTLDEELSSNSTTPGSTTSTRSTKWPELDRRIYFQGAAAAAGRTGQVQDWVQHSKQKVVGLFEGRDSRGKGGVIKRITQRAQSRICRVAALPARTSASGPSVLPALRLASCRRAARSCLFEPQLVQPRRRRARDGLLQRRAVPGVLQVGAESSAC